MDLHLPETLNRAITAYAQATDRSRNEVIAHLLTQGIRREPNPSPYSMDDTPELDAGLLPTHLGQHDATLGARIALAHLAAGSRGHMLAAVEAAGFPYGTELPAWKRARELALQAFNTSGRQGVPELRAELVRLGGGQ